MKNSIIKLGLLCLLCMSAWVAYAQPTNSIINDVVTPPPNAAAFGRYLDVPVNLSSGVPQVGVPIHTVTEGPLSLPIALSYHASGLKVGEPSTWIGTGWSLQAGGMITRTIQSLPDENGVGYYNGGGSLTLTTSNIEDAANGDLDSEPDIFSFSAGGYSGRFMFDKDQNIFMMPEQDIDIAVDYQSNRFIRFTITLPDGTKYIYGNLSGSSNWSAIDRTHFTPASLSTLPPHSSSWYLVKIESMDSLWSINLEYETEYYSYKSLASCNYTRLVDGCTEPGGYNRLSCSGMSDDGGNTYYTKVHMEGKRLKKIYNSSGTDTVNFIPKSTVRQDLEVASGTYFVNTNTAYALDQIEVKSGTYCSLWDLGNDDYFESATTGGKAENFRLKLEDIQQKSCDNTITIPKHFFTYEGGTNTNGSQFLPGRLSKATDHWGFYNGKTTNQSHPTNIPATSFVYGSSTIAYGSSDRESNADVMDIGVLTKIQYPTGGSAYFTFEANRIDETLLGENQLLYLENCPLVAEACCTASDPESVISFADTDEINNAKIDLYMQVAETSLICGPGDCICDGASSRTIDLEAWDVAAGTLVGSNGFNLGGVSIDELTVNLSTLGTFLPNKDYKFVLKVVNGRGTARIYADYTQSVVANRPVGGLRIQQIRISPDDTQGSNDIIKTFEYTDPDDTNLSSGVLRNKPVYGIGQTYVNSGGGNGWFATMQDHSFVALSGLNGSHIEYERVLEKHNGNGYRDHRFNIIGVALPLTLPTPPQQYDPQDGISLETSTYNENDELVAKQSNVAKTISYTGFSGTVFKVRDLNAPCPVNGGSDILGYYKPSILTEDYTGQMRTDAFYYTQSTSELDGVVTVTDYFYENSNYTNPSKMIMTNSDNQLTITKYKYAYDLSSECIKDNLLDRNMVGIPLITEVYVGADEATATLLSGVRTDYSTYNATSGVAQNCITNGAPYPYEIYNYEMTITNGTPSSGSWNLVTTIDKIDPDNGKPTEITQRGWEKEILEWDNDNKLIKKRTFEDFEWTYEYYPDTRLVSKITDVDGQFVQYYYDALMRLSSTSARNGKVTNAYDYTYKNGSIPNFVKSTLTLDGATFSDYTEKIVCQYLDGIGRVIQTVDQEHSPGSTPKDIVRAITYDKHGREEKVYEPFESTLSTGAYVASIPGGTAYSEMAYYDSPLNRVKTQTPPDWYATTTEYGANGENEVIGYGENQLIKTVVIDGNGFKDIQFKDKKGRLILSRRSNADGSLKSDTYNYYDAKDRLIKVVPPDAGINDAGLIFQYYYDDRDRIISKIIPDQGETVYEYDNRDLVTYMQDENMASQGRWLHTQYDVYGREVKTGFINNVLNIDGTQNSNFDELLTQNYYDGYDFSGTVPDIYIGKVRRVDTKILGTNDWLEAYTFYDSDGRVEKTEGNHHLNLGNLQAEVINYQYDWADNVTSQSRVHTRLGGSTTTILDEMHYDHMGRLVKAYHQVDGGTKVQLSELDYTHKDQLKTKNLGKVGTSFLQQLDFEYLENGFLKKMNGSTLSGTNSALPGCNNDLPAQAAASSSVNSNDLFYMELAYDQQIHTEAGVPIQKNGNIAQMVWRVRGRDQQMYSYTYDYQNRLTNAKYNDVNGSGVKSNDNKYTTAITYDDKRGNIKTITRNSYLWDGSCWAPGQIDNLTFDYYSTTNKLKDVSEAVTNVDHRDKGYKYYDSTLSGADYTYDANGNMTYDPSKVMNVEYNYLNLPTRMEFPNCKVIEFIYDAGGTKLSKVISQDVTIIKKKDYLGGIEYLNGSIEAIYHIEGRVYYEDGSGRYEYNLNDHLGNTRLSFTDKDGDGILEATDDPETNEILSETHYYPFGMAMEGPWMQNAGRDNPYLYNGKELNEEFGLNWLSYGAREYDAAIGRWMSVDPLAEAYSAISPFTYVANNPIIFIDPDGRKIINGAEENRKNAEEEFEKYDKIVSDAKSKYGTKKKDFGNKERFKRFREIKKLRRQAKANLAFWTSESRNSQNMIDGFRATSPVMFNLMDNLENEQGETVDLFIVSTDKVMGNENDGGNIFRFFNDDQGNIVPHTSFGINSIEIQISNNPSGGRSHNEVIRHELGHAFINGRFTGYYYRKGLANGYLKKGKKGISILSKGHSKGDPSGIMADEFGKMADFPRIYFRGF